MTIRWTISFDSEGGDVTLYSGPDRIGYVDMHPVSRLTNTFETHSWLEKPYRGKGYGLIGYEVAINFLLTRGFTVVSSTKPSYWATRVWESERLSAKFDIGRLSGRYRVLGVKKVSEKVA